MWTLCILFLDLPQVFNPHKMREKMDHSLVRHSLPLHPRPSLSNLTVDHHRSYLTFDPNPFPNLYTSTSNTIFVLRATPIVCVWPW